MKSLVEIASGPTHTVEGLFTLVIVSGILSCHHHCNIDIFTEHLHHHFSKINV